MSIPYITGLLLYPIFGLLTDKIGISIPFIYPTFKFNLLGLLYEIFRSVIWSTITYIIPDGKIGITNDF